MTRPYPDTNPVARLLHPAATDSAGAGDGFSSRQSPAPAARYLVPFVGSERLSLKSRAGEFGIGHGGRSARIETVGIAMLGGCDSRDEPVNNRADAFHVVVSFAAAHEEQHSGGREYDVPKRGES